MFLNIKKTINMKYKLVKTYPLCPFELGAIATDEEVKSDVMLCIRTDVGRYTTYPKEAIVDNPEFWEKVKEKEYTILSFVSTEDGRIRNRVEPNNYFKEDTYVSEKGGCNYPLTSMLYGNDSVSDGGQKIHSVRRESDGEVFTLGDKIDTSDYRSKEIEKFEIEKETLYIHFDFGRNILSLMNKCRKPILVTEDGVEIFDDTCVYVPQVNFKKELTGDIIEFRANAVSGDIKSFSTKEKAEEYLKWNKPMYSLNDIMDACMDTDGVIGRLEKLGRK